MLASGRSRNGRRGQHTRAATPYCTPGKSLGLVGGKGGEHPTPRATRMPASDTPGTGAAVSMPKPLRPTARQENLGAGRGKGGSTHNHKDYLDARLGALQARAPRSACRGQDTLYKPGKSMGLSMGELKRGSTHNHKDDKDVRLGALQARTPWVARRGRYALLHARKELGAGRGTGRGKRGKHPQSQGRQGCPPRPPPGTDTMGSTPGPRRPLQARKEHGA